MNSTMKMTKQGIRDLNFYGPRSKVVATDPEVLAALGAPPETIAPALGGDPEAVVDAPVGAGAGSGTA